MLSEEDLERLERERDRAIASAVRALADLVRERHIEAAVLLERASIHIDPDEAGFGQRLQ